MLTINFYSNTALNIRVEFERDAVNQSRNGGSNDKR